MQYVIAGEDRSSHGKMPTETPEAVPLQRDSATASAATRTASTMPQTTTPHPSLLHPICSLGHASCLMQVSAAGNEAAKNSCQNLSKTSFHASQHKTKTGGDSPKKGHGKKPTITCNDCRMQVTRKMLKLTLKYLVWIHLKALGVCA